MLAWQERADGTIGWARGWIVHGNTLVQIEATPPDAGGPPEAGRYPAARAEKALEIIEDPLLRTYYFAYAEGEALLRRWLEAVAEPERAARFGRLLHEQLTPAAVTVPG